MYTIVHWEDRPERGGPMFLANVGPDTYKVSGVDFQVGARSLTEVMIWRGDTEVWYAPGTSDAVGEFEAFIASLR